MPASVCFVVGARPNFMKVAPVMRALGALDPTLDLRLVHTGQHYDDAMSDVFLSELGLPDPDVFLAVGSGLHGAQTARALEGLENVFVQRRPDVVVVAGDVNSTLAGALAAAKLDIDVAHIEAGLRSFDLRMPEEHNRKLTDHLSTILLTHSDEANGNLAREGIDAASVHLVGNTMIDSVLQHVEQARARRPWSDLGLDPGGYGLITLHRPSLVDDPDLLAATVVALADLAEDQPLVFPVHPRTEAHLRELGLRDDLESSGVLQVPPLPYLAFLGLEAEARFVLTDSGGVQEETSALGVPCFTLRGSTERPVTIDSGTNVLLGADPARIGEIRTALADPQPHVPIPLWDGQAGPRAASVLAEFLRRNVHAPSAASRS